MTRPDIEPRSSGPLANTLLIRPIDIIFFFFFFAISNYKIFFENTISYKFFSFPEDTDTTENEYAKKESLENQHHNYFLIEKQQSNHGVGSFGVMVKVLDAIYLTSHCVKI